MSGVIPSNLTKNDISILNHFPEVHKHGIHTHRYTHTHTLYDIIRRNAMRCISPKNGKLYLCWKCYYCRRRQVERSCSKCRSTFHHAASALPTRRHRKSLQTSTSTGTCLRCRNVYLWQLYLI